MSPFAIVIYFRVLENSSFRLITGFSLHPVDQFDFKRMEKTFNDGIVPTIALFTHTSNEFILGQERLKIITGILTATVRIADQTLG